MLTPGASEWQLWGAIAGDGVALPTDNEEAILRKIVGPAARPSDSKNDLLRKWLGAPARPGDSDWDLLRKKVGPRFSFGDSFYDMLWKYARYVTSTPVAPEDLVATTLTTSTVELDWSDLATNETGYKVFVSDDNLTFVEGASLPAGTTTAVVSDLFTDTQYWFKVAAFNDAGTVYSNVATATTLANEVPGGSNYEGNPPTYTLDVLADSFYIITWGANDLSVQIGADTYDSAGVGTTLRVNTGVNTQMVFTGTFAGTQVTLVVKRVKPHMPDSAPTNFTWALNGDETLVLASWDAAPAEATNVELWTSTTGHHFTYNKTVLVPNTSTTVAAPAPGSSLYGRIKYCTNTQCGKWSDILQVTVVDPGAVEANLWADRVVANGGARPSANTISAAAIFLNGLESAGVKSKLKAVNIVAPDNLVAATTPLIVGPGLDPWTNMNFVAGDLTVNGLKGDGSSKYLKTGFLGSNFGAGNYNAGLTAYCFDSPFGDHTLIGANDGNAPVRFLRLGAFQAVTAFSAWNGNVGQGAAARADAFCGYICGNVTGAAARTIYEASGAVAHNTLATATGGAGGADGGPVAQLYAWALNNNGTAQQFARNRISFLAIHEGLSSGESSALHTAVHALRVSLGGGYIADISNTQQMVDEWSKRITVAGGAAPAAGTKTAAKTFLDTLSSAGILAKMKSVNIFAPDNLTAACAPLIRHAGTDVWENVNFVGGDLTNNGLVGNGSSKYLKTGVRAGTIWRLNDTSVNAGMSLYNTTASDAACVDLGVSQSGVGVWFLMPSDTGKAAYAAYGANVGADQIYTANSGWTGFVTGNKTTATASALHKANNSAPTLASVGTAVGGTNGNTISAEVLMFAGNYGTATSITPQYYSTKRYSFAAMHDGLSVTEAQALSNAVVALRTSLGGGLVPDAAIDTVESYSLGSLNALNGGTNGVTALWNGAYHANTAYLSSYHLDTMESYTDSSNLNGLNGGTDWTSAYVGKTAYLSLYQLDTLESYSEGNLNGLNSGTGWSGAFVARTGA